MSGNVVEVFGGGLLRVIRGKLKIDGGGCK